MTYNYMILHILKGLTLALWTAFLFWLLNTGQDYLIRLLHPRLWWIVGAGAIIVLLFLGVHVCSRPLRQISNTLLLQLPGLLLLSLPFLYFVQAKDARFDQSTFKQRGLQNDQGFIQGEIPGLMSNTSKGDEEEDSLISIIREYESYRDSEAEVVCQTFVDSRLPENLSMCYRYLITCCAADAAPVFIFLRHPETLNITNDAWVRVKGPVSHIESQATAVPVLDIDTVTYVEEPAFPWLF